MENKRNLYLLGGIILVVIIAGAGFWYWRAQQGNHLIPRVPYHGIYDCYFDCYGNPVTSVLTVLEYYGDERFSRDELMKRIPRGDKVSLKMLGQFFEENGYDTYFATPPKEKVIYEIKKFVNPDKNIPVIVLKKRSPDPQFEENVYATVIGISDKERKMIVHEYLFGNNYEISYDDFAGIYAPRRFPRTMLAVWPSENLAPQLKGKNTALPYPLRLPLMDTVGPFLAKQSDIGFMVREAEEDPARYEDIVKFAREQNIDPRLESFHPLMKIYLRTGLARILRKADKINPQGRLDEAIKVITDEVLPLNHDLNQPYQGWILPSKLIKNGKVAFPLMYLGTIYQLKGDFNKAFDSLEAAWAIDTSNFIIQPSTIPRAYDIYESIIQDALRRNPTDTRALQWLRRVEKARLEI